MTFDAFGLKTNEQAKHREGSKLSKQKKRVFVGQLSTFEANFRHQRHKNSLYESERI